MGLETLVTEDRGVMAVMALMEELAEKAAMPEIMVVTVQMV